MGNDGTQFPPFMEKNEPKWMFVGELCRSIWVDYIKETDYEGINTYEFRPGDDVFNMRDPDNFCFCPHFEECATRYPDRDEWNMTVCFDKCKDGIMRISNCEFIDTLKFLLAFHCNQYFAGASGLPLIMSAPHFLRGHQTLIDAFDGLAPNYDDHDTVLLIETVLRRSRGSP